MIIEEKCDYHKIIAPTFVKEKQTIKINIFTSVNVFFVRISKKINKR